MNEFVIVVLYAVLPAFGNLVGALLAERVDPPRWAVGASLHGAAGITIALVSIDLMPRILDALSAWVAVVAFVGGAAISVLLAHAVGATRRVQDNASRAWMVYAAIGADLVADGMMVGAGSAIASALGLMLAAAQALANIPGGFAAGANLRAREVARSRRIATAWLMFVPVLTSAGAAFALLAGSSPQAKTVVLALLLGVLLLATIEDISPEGDAPRPRRWISSACFAAGFGGFVLLSSALAAVD
jgi:ZIP family zinc transporter